VTRTTPSEPQGRRERGARPPTRFQRKGAKTQRRKASARPGNTTKTPRHQGHPPTHVGCFAGASPRRAGCARAFRSRRAGAPNASVRRPGSTSPERAFGAHAGGRGSDETAVSSSVSFINKREGGVHTHTIFSSALREYRRSSAGGVAGDTAASTSAGTRRRLRVACHPRRSRGRRCNRSTSQATCMGGRGLCVFASLRFKWAGGGTSWRAGAARLRCCLGYAGGPVKIRENPCRIRLGGWALLSLRPCVSDGWVG
jgi:hypothetical protein